MLHVTQLTLSRQIADLEKELGVKLFVRSNHNIILTEDGMILKRRAQEILSLAEKTKGDFMQKDEALSGIISIGSGEFRSTEYLAKIIAGFRQKNPNVKYKIYSGNGWGIGFVSDASGRFFLRMEICKGFRYNSDVGNKQDILICKEEAVP